MASPKRPAATFPGEEDLSELVRQPTKESRQPTSTRRDPADLREAVAVPIAMTRQVIRIMGC
jgi:hypothetical protein